MNRFFTATALFVCSLALLAPRALAKDKTVDESEQIKKVEQQWADAYLKGDSSALERIEADDYVFNDPAGGTHGKTEDLQDVKSGAVKWSDFKVEDMKVRIYGKTAVVTGVARVKGTYKGQDMSGLYRFTDVLVRKKEDWRAVSTQLTLVADKK